jgi:hypothetical protein
MRDYAELVGLVEWVKIVGCNREIWVRGRIDTGASRTAVDEWLGSKVGLGPGVGTAKVRSSLSKTSTRQLTTCTLEVAGSKFTIPIAISDRSNMRYPVLIGRDILRAGNFLIDPKKKIKKHPPSSEKNSTPGVPK